MFNPPSRLFTKEKEGQQGFSDASERQRLTDWNATRQVDAKRERERERGREEERKYRSTKFGAKPDRRVFMGQRISGAFFFLVAALIVSLSLSQGVRFVQGDDDCNSCVVRKFTFSFLFSFCFSFSFSFPFSSVYWLRVGSNH